MGDLLNLLHIGQSGAEAAQFGVRTAGQNIANVSTPGFHRRVVIQEQANISPASVQKLGDGVRIIGAHRVIDEALDRRARNAQSESIASQTRSNLLARANVSFGDLVGEGISPSLDGLLASFDELAATPQDPVARRDVLASAELFAAEIRRYATEVGEIRSDIDSQLRVEVDRINSLVEEIAEANRLISEEVSASPDLLDRRGRLVEELAEKTDIRTAAREDGSLDVHLSESGYTLVAGRFSAGLNVEQQPEGARVVGFGFGGARRDFTGTIVGGAVGGLLIARDGDLGTLSSSLDNFAFQVADAVNTIHSTGYGSDGVTGRNLFLSPQQQVGAALSFQVDAAVAGNPVAVAAAQSQAAAEGGNGVALALAAFRHDKAINGMEPSEALQGLLQEFGDRVYQADINATSRGEAAVQLRELQQSISGVSLDEEVTNLIRYQQAYAAAAQVMQTADQLMQELIALRR